MFLPEPDHVVLMGGNVPCRYANHKSHGFPCKGLVPESTIVFVNLALAIFITLAVFPVVSSIC